MSRSSVPSGAKKPIAPPAPADAYRSASCREPNSPLRLAIAGSSLGLETYLPLSLGPLSIPLLAWSLPSLAFPIDLSGGVDAFRHRRGHLRRLSLAANQAELERALTGRLRSVAGGNEATVSLWAVESGIGLGVSGFEEAIAFDLIWAPAGTTARWIIGNARTASETTVPLARALRLSDTLFGKYSKREGRVVRIESLASQVARQVVPPLGARVPAGSEANVCDLRIREAKWTLEIDSSHPSPALSKKSIVALELALLASQADTALASGNWSEARECYLAALQKAPRHPELVRLIAQIDAASDSQCAEGALGMLVDCLPVVQFGAVGATLLARTGEFTSARQAMQQAASAEQFAPIIAELWCRLAGLASGANEQRRALDRAVGAAPGLASVRLARFEARAGWQDESGAVADAQQLEAGARSSREKHSLLVQCGHSLVRSGLTGSAGKLFERALRYTPDDPEATYGLALGLLRGQKKQRALALLQRAVEISSQQGTVHCEALLELAQQLAEQTGDLPQAVARLGQVPPAHPRLTVRARALEGRYRAALGDNRGASAAFSELRVACERFEDKALLRHAANWLAEAAQFELTKLQEVDVAEQHLAMAIRLDPRNESLRSEYRRVAALADQ